MLNKMKIFFLLFLGMCISIILILSGYFNLSIQKSIIISFIVSVFGIEIIFRLYEFFISKKSLTYPQQKFSDLYLESHPYLPYKHKRNSVIQTTNFSFPIKNFIYKSTEIKINRLGEIESQINQNMSDNGKKKFRIIMMGDSTIVSHLSLDNVVYNIPNLLEKRLNENQSDFIFEVINSGVCGATIAHTIVKLVLDDIFKNPDIIIFQLGYANIRSFFYDQYKPDESHFLKGLENFEIGLKISQKIPDFKLKILRFLIQQFFPTNFLKDIHKFTWKEGFDISLNPNGMEYFEKKLSSLLGVCKSHKTSFVLSTFSHYLHDDILENYAHGKFNDASRKINHIIKKFSKDNAIPFVDLDTLVEKNKQNFIDEAHYSHLGMQICAKHHADVIEKMIRDRLEVSNT